MKNSKEEPTQRSNPVSLHISRITVKIHVKPTPIPRPRRSLLDPMRPMPHGVPLVRE